MSWASEVSDTTDENGYRVFIGRHDYMKQFWAVVWEPDGTRHLICRPEPRFHKSSATARAHADRFIASLADPKDAKRSPTESPSHPEEGGA